MHTHLHVKQNIPVSTHLLHISAHEQHILTSDYTRIHMCTKTNNLTHTSTHENKWSAHTHKAQMHVGHSHNSTRYKMSYHIHLNILTHKFNKRTIFDKEGRQRHIFSFMHTLCIQLHPHQTKRDKSTLIKYHLPQTSIDKTIVKDIFHGSSPW